MDLELNDLKRLIYHKTNQSTYQPTNRNSTLDLYLPYSSTSKHTVGDYLIKTYKVRLDADRL